MAIKLECSNCVLEKELPENISLERLNAEADQFFKEHKTRIGNCWCKKQNIFIRTFTVRDGIIPDKKTA